MADILISASSQDKEIAEQLGRLFAARGLNVDWMPLDPVEPGNRAGIVRRRASARVTVALWSKHSVNDAQVLEDAREALRRGSLLTARMEDIIAPPEFRASPTANLTGWDGSDSHIQAGRLLTEAAKLLERTSTRPALALAAARLNRSPRGGGGSAALRPSPAIAWPDAIANAGAATAASPAPEVKSAAAIAPAAVQTPFVAKTAEPAPVPTPAPATISGDAPKDASDNLTLTPAAVKTASEVAEEKLEANPAPVMFAGEAANDALPLRPANVTVSEAASTEPTYQTFTFEPEPKVQTAPDPAPAARPQTAARVIAPAAAPAPEWRRKVSEAPRQQPRATPAARNSFFKEPRDRTDRDDRNHYVAILLGAAASIALLVVWLNQRPQDFAATTAQTPAISAAAQPSAAPSAAEPDAITLERAAPPIAPEPSAPQMPDIAIASDLPLMAPAPVLPQAEAAAPAPTQPIPEAPEMRPAGPALVTTPAAKDGLGDAESAQTPPASSPPTLAAKAPAKAAPPVAAAKAPILTKSTVAGKPAPAKIKSAASSAKAKRLAEVGRALDARAAAPAQTIGSKTIAALAGAAAPAPLQNADPFDPQQSLTVLRLGPSDAAFHLPGLAPSMLGAWTPGPDAPAPVLNAPITDAEWNAAPARTLAQSALIAGSYKDHLAHAQGGDRRAMLILGLMRQTGIGEAQDDARAFAWLRRAALAGDPRALAEIGAYYAAGIGALRDDARAVRNFDRSAMLGAAAGKTAIGWALATGRGLPADAVKARVAFADAAQAGDPLAALNLGRMQADGLGGVKDVAAAKLSFAKAADQGFAPAQYALGVLLLLDLPDAAGDANAATTRTYAETLAALRVQQAAAQGYPPAQALLGALYQHGIGVAQDNSMARAWLARAPGS